MTTIQLPPGSGVPPNKGSAFTVEPQMVAVALAPAFGASISNPDVGMPISSGSLLFTRNWKPLPESPAGKMQVTVPEAVDTTEPSTVGLAKEPLTSDSSAVKVFPTL